VQLNSTFLILFSYNCFCLKDHNTYNNLIIIILFLYLFFEIAIQCPQPLVPINGRIDGTSGSSSISHRRYAVGALVTFSCTEGHLLVGEASIVCTETGFWSHPPPFCKFHISV